MLGIIGAGAAIFFIMWQRPLGLALVLVAVSAGLGIVACYMPYRQLVPSQQFPPIHDITTDFSNPPAFVAIARVRVAAPNPLSYDGPQVGAEQRRAYPDIRTVTFAHDPGVVFPAALQLVDELSWDLVEANAAQGRIEATVTSRWFGFKDDIVMRIAPGTAGTALFDMRSKSRVGVSDMGSNARHVREFMNGLLERLD
ncbi:MAG: hypothetical protein RLZZ227_2163 [Pseudomonadota bacterium]